MFEINTTISSMTKDIREKNMGISCQCNSAHGTLKTIIQYFEWLQNDQAIRPNSDKLILNQRVRDLRELSKNIVKKDQSQTQDQHWIIRIFCYVILAIKHYFIQRQAKQIDDLAGKWMRNHSVITMDILPKDVIGFTFRFSSTENLIAISQTSKNMRKIVTEFLLDRAKAKYGFRQVSSPLQFCEHLFQLNNEFNSIIEIIKKNDNQDFSDLISLSKQEYSIECLVRLSKIGPLLGHEHRKLLGLLFAFSIAEQKKLLLNFLIRIHRSVSFKLDIHLMYSKRILDNDGATQSGSTQSGTALAFAVKRNNVDAVKFLWAKIPEINPYKFLPIAIDHSSLDVISFLLTQPALQSDPGILNKIILYSIKYQVWQPIHAVLSKTDREANDTLLQTAFQTLWDHAMECHKPFFGGRPVYSEFLTGELISLSTSEIISFFLLQTRSSYLTGAIDIFLNNVDESTFYYVLELLAMGYYKFNDLNLENNFSLQVGLVRKLLDHGALSYPKFYNVFLYEHLKNRHGKWSEKCLLQASSSEYLIATLNEALLKDNSTVATILLDHGIQPDPNVAIHCIDLAANHVTKSCQSNILWRLLFNPKDSAAVATQLSTIVQTRHEIERHEGPVQKTKYKHGVRDQDLLELILFLKTDTHFYDKIDKSVFSYFSHQVVTDVLNAKLLENANAKSMLRAESMLRHGAKPNVKTYELALTQRLAVYFYDHLLLSEMDWTNARIKLFAAIENLIPAGEMLPSLSPSTEQLPEEMYKVLNFAIINNVNYCLSLLKKGRECAKLYSLDDVWFS